MIPGNLLELPFDCKFLNANDKTCSYIPIIKDSIFLCIGEMELLDEWINRIVPGRGGALAAGWERTVGVMERDAPPTNEDNDNSLEKLKHEVATLKEVTNAWLQYDTTLAGAKEELQKTGTIKGFKFLCPNGINFVWLSHYDVKMLEQENTR